MATPVCMKRMRREREQLENSDSKEFCVSFKDEDLLNFVAYISGPEDSLYRHKFIKLKFEVPSNYPLVPPKVTFVQLSGGRIHPNLYTEGKVCLSILGTWSGEPWATAMNIESVLITIRSLLDNKPYMHEPNQKDNPLFNDYVRYASWNCLLLDHLQYEQDPKLKGFMLQHLQDHSSDVLDDLQKQSQQHANIKTFRSTYGRQTINADYTALTTKLKTYIPTPTVTVDQPLTRKTKYSAQSRTLASTGLPTPQSLSPNPLHTTESTSSTKLSQPNSKKRKASHLAGGNAAQPIDLDAGKPKKQKTSQGCILQ